MKRLTAKGLGDGSLAIETGPHVSVLLLSHEVPQAQTGDLPEVRVKRHED